MSDLKAQSSKDMIIRNYRPGDEPRLVNFLNLCYGEWGTQEKWCALYSQYPTFSNDNVFIIEKNTEIIGHESLHFRNLTLQRELVLDTVSLSDAATHPRYRGRGIHNKLLEVMLTTAKSKGCGLVFSWYLRGTGLHNHSRKLGFVEVKQPPAYMKVMKPEKVIRSGLLDFIQKSPSLKQAVQDLEDDVYLCLGESEFSIKEFIGNAEKKGVDNRRKVEIIFEESSIFALAKFRTLNKRERLQLLALLLLLRKAKVKFGSFKAFLSLVRTGVAIIGSI